MSRKKRRHADDLRAAVRLVVEATQRITGTVEQMHRTIAGGPAVLDRPLEGAVRPIASLVYGSIRGVTQLVGSSLDLALEQLAPALGESAPGPERMALVAALNGVLGDYLAETESPLAIAMRLCRDGHALELDRAALRAAYPEATGKLAVWVHGSSMSDGQWTRDGHDHGAALAKDLGYAPVYLRYNSGLHISTNGRELSPLLDRLVAEWPTPVDDLALLGHSMGGLVARSACHVAEAEGHAWRSRLRTLACIGSPHHGAPLERGGNWLEMFLGISRYSAPLAQLAKVRSAGVTDLRFGNVLDEHWNGCDRFALELDRRTKLALPDGVECFAIAGTKSLAPAAALRSDGLVPVDSALGRHENPALVLAFPESHQWIGYGIGHLALLGSGAVYERIQGWLRG